MYTNGREQMALSCPFASKIGLANAQGYSRSRVQLWLLRARLIAAKASTGRGTEAVYGKEGIDPCSGDANYCECVPVTSFRTGINGDAGLWAGCTTAPAKLAYGKPLSRTK